MKRDVHHEIGRIPPSRRRRRHGTDQRRRAGSSGCQGRNGARWARTATGPTPATATVRDAERLVQVEVADVAAEAPGLGDADEAR